MMVVAVVIALAGLALCCATLAIPVHRRAWGITYIAGAGLWVTGLALAVCS